LNGVQVVAGSNPVIPTILFADPFGDRHFSWKKDIHKRSCCCRKKWLYKKAASLDFEKKTILEIDS